MTEETLRTALYDLHRELGGKMVEFAGYAMPVQYADGIVTEHKHTRAAAGLFDVSHMGQARIDADDLEAAIAAVEGVVPGDIKALDAGRIRYTMLTNPEGGIIDDLMITRMADHLYLVVNASRKAIDLPRFAQGLGGTGRLTVLEDRALLALQGPQAVEVLSGFDPAAADMPFMSARDLRLMDWDCHVSRSGYTGEDGFEISVPADCAEDLARRLLADDRVRPIGLGARDSLRLEAGLCLYGHDIDENTTPIEAGLTWTISKRRREQGGFPGDHIIQRQLEEGVQRKRVGILPDGRAPAREGTEILDADGQPLGAVTSGGFGPSLGGPMAMGYVSRNAAQPGTELQLMVRGKALPARVAKMPFVPHNYV